jgi:hypothetical protein
MSSQVKQVALIFLETGFKNDAFCVKSQGDEAVKWSRIGKSVSSDLTIFATIQLSFK